MEFKYEIIEKLGVIEDRGEWKKEVNIVAWNGRAPKVDIRDWNDTHEKMSKGITLTEDHAKKVYEILKGRYE